MSATVRRVLGSAGSVCPPEDNKAVIVWPAADNSVVNRRQRGHRTAVDHRAETAVLPEHVCATPG